MRGVASDGAPQALFAAVISVLCLACVYVAAIVAGYGPGLAAGLNAGAQTISASIQVATERDQPARPAAEQAKAEIDRIPVAYAITYLFGTIRHRLDPRIPRPQAARRRSRGRVQAL